MVNYFLFNLLEYFLFVICYSSLVDVFTRMTANCSFSKILVSRMGYLDLIGVQSSENPISMKEFGTTLYGKSGKILSVLI